jgi:hypothetical protein
VDETELQISQNGLEFLFPYGAMIDPLDIIREVGSYNTTTDAFIQSLGLGKATGKLTLTKDPKILDQLDRSKLTTPGIIKHDVRSWDQLKVKELDKITVNHNLFLEYHGGENMDETVIIPVHIQANFLGGFRKGIGSRNGHSQEFASEWLNPFLVEMQPCQRVKSANLIEGDDDFIDLICSDAARHVANFVSYQRSGLYMLRFTERQSDAANNVWNTFDALEQPFSLLCAGIEIKHPQARIENGSFHMNIKQRKDALNIDQYCDNKGQELVDLHPSSISEHEDKRE